MNRAELKTLIATTRRELRAYEEISTGCTTCEFFHYWCSRCTRFDCSVPQEHVATGCADWQYDEIPF